MPIKICLKVIKTFFLFNYSNPIPLVLSFHHSNKIKITRYVYFLKKMCITGTYNLKSLQNINYGFLDTIYYFIIYYNIRIYSTSVVYIWQALHSKSTTTTISLKMNQFLATLEATVYKRRHFVFCQSVRGISQSNPVLPDDRDSHHKLHICNRKSWPLHIQSGSLWAYNNDKRHSWRALVGGSFVILDDPGQPTSKQGSFDQTPELFKQIELR